MTSDEIRSAVEDGRGVSHDPNNGVLPPLLLIYRNRLSTRAIENLKDAMRRAMTGPNRDPIVIEEGPEVFQLVAGQWQLMKADQ